MKIILDAHVLIWTLYDEGRLTSEAKTHLESSTDLLVVSHATLWELFAKIGRGKLLIAGDSVAAVLQDIHDLGVTMLPITEDHIVAASTLPRHHSDPFDRMLVAQAMAEDAVILSADRVLPSYGVRVIWK